MPLIKQHILIYRCFFICVRTKLDCVVAEFEVQSEPAEYINEAISVLEAVEPRVVSRVFHG